MSLQNLSCSWADSLVKRHSVRSYDSNARVPEEKLKKIISYMNATLKEKDNLFCEDTSMFRMEYHQFSLNDGFIQGDRECISIIGPKNTGYHGLMKSGYLFQKVILYCTTLGISTCWVGGRWLTERLDGYLRKKEGYSLDRSEHVICLSPIGFCSYGSLFNRPSHSWGKTRERDKNLFFDSEYGNPLIISPKFKQVFEGFKWAPSACNYQKWKIIKDKENEEYHFMTNPSGNFYSNIDIGIGICNWEVGCKEFGIRGEFYQKTKVNFRLPSGGRYFLTWKGL